MQLWEILIFIIGWILLYYLLYRAGMKLLNVLQKSFSNRWGEFEKLLYDEKKKDYKFYLTVFFVAIPLLIILSELFG